MLKANTPWNEVNKSQTTMTIRNRGLRTDRHQDSKEDRTRWEPVQTDKALAEAMAAKAEICRETSIWIWRSEHYNAQGQLLHRLQRRTRARRNAEVHRKRIRRNAIAGLHPYGGNKRSRTITHARSVKLHKKSQERRGPDAR